MLLSGNDIRNLRIKAGYNQQDLADKLKITNVYLSMLENDKVAGTFMRIKIQLFFEEMEDKITIPSVS